MDAKESELNRVSKQKFANLYAKLLDVAKRGEKTFYSDVMGLVGLDHHMSQDRKVIGGILALISRAEVGQGRPMLSSVVWRKDIDRIGPGFIPLARKRWLAPGSGTLGACSRSASVNWTYLRTEREWES